MSEAALPPLEMILRQCASAAPQPWYPKQYAQQTSISRDTLDPHLERLRLGGFVELTDWTQEYGQGYRLTPAGQELLDRPRVLERVRQGDLPEGRPPEPDPVVQPQVEIEGDRVREAMASQMAFRPRVTIAILWLNIAVFGVGLMLAQRAGTSISDYLGMNPPESILLQEGALRGNLVYKNHQWWRLISNAFVHIGLFHLITNMIGLWFIGPFLERALGPGRYLLFYLLSALGGSLGVLIDAPGAPTAGASGAIFGLMGGLTVYVFAYRRSLPPEVFRVMSRQLLGVILLNVFLTLNIARISKGGHFGGGIAGALLVMPVDSLRLRRGIRAVLAAIVIIALTGGGFRYAYQSLERAVARHEVSTEGLQRRMKTELDEFNENFVKQIGKQDRDAEKLTRDSLSELRAFENRDADDVKKYRKLIATQSASMNQLKAELGRVGPFLAENVEDARQTGIRLMTANVALLARIDGCLQHQERCDLDKEDAEVKKERAHWHSLLGPG